MWETLSDISTIKPNDGNENILRYNCHIMVDKRTGCKFSNFYDTKNGVVEPTLLSLRNDDKPR